MADQHTSLDCSAAGCSWHGQRLLLPGGALQALLRETGKRPSADSDLQRTSEVSLTALLDNGGFYHPVSGASSLFVIFA